MEFDETGLSYILVDTHNLKVYNFWQVLVFVYKSLNGLTPTYHSDRIKAYVPSRSPSSVDNLFLVVQW